MHRYIVIFLLVLNAFIAKAQQVPAPIYYSNLSPVNEFPKFLQSKRSVIIVNVPGDWEKFANKVHSKLILMSIDPVLYIDYRDIISGTDATKAILNHLEERKISYLLTFGKNDNNQFDVNITSAKNFLKAASPVHKSTYMAHVDLQRLLKNMANELIKAELQKTNFLMVEKPEILRDVKILENRKFEVHARDVNRLKLAVPKFQRITDDQIAALQNKEVANQYNLKVDRWNKDLESIMKEFPYKYEFVETTLSDDLFRKGFQYALFHIETKGMMIKKMLNMATEQGETDYVSYTTQNSLKRINVNTPVAKFYIKQVVTNDVYIGDKWDADVTWQESLRNYIFNFKKFVGKK